MRKEILIFMALMCFTGSIYGIELDAISVVPPTPDPFDDIELNVTGTFDHSLAQTIQRAPWQRIGNEIHVDLLVIELPLEAPSIPAPFEQPVDLGQLPAGEYEVTARVFITYPGPYPDPWTFPNEFAGRTPVDTLEYKFVVIPEPNTFSLLVLGGMMVCRRTRRIGSLRIDAV